MLFNLKKYRTNLGLSQVKLSSESGVSLPTIQNIEANKANPTLDVLEKLAKALAIDIIITPITFDINRAIAYGVPLSGDNKSEIPLVALNPKSLRDEVKKWHYPLLEKKLSPREEISIVSFLKAISDHYPAYYKAEISSPIFEKKLKEYASNPQLIKLRRIALSLIGKYL